MKIKIVVLLAALAVVSCSSDSSSDSDSESSSSGDTGSGGTTGSLAISSAYPEGLTVTAFPQALDESPGETAPGTLSTALTNQQDTATQDFKHPKKSLSEADAILKGTADSCYDETDLGKLNNNINQTEVCFGFDYGIVSGTAIGVADGGQLNNTVQNNNSSVDSIKSALESLNTLQADSSGEACMVAVGRHLIRSTSNKLTAALGLLRGLICGTKKIVVMT